MNPMKFARLALAALPAFLIATTAFAIPYRSANDAQRASVLEHAPIIMLHPQVAASPRRVQALTAALAARAASMRSAANYRMPNAADLISWTAAGPDNIGGRVNAILTNPANPQQLFIGTSSGGIWKSADGGARWVSVGDFLASLAVTSLARLPDGTLLAGTGDQFNNPRRGVGILESTDNGAKWTPLASTDPSGNPAWHYINDIAVNPDGAILAAVGVGSAQTSGGIFRSDDAGQTFTEVQTGSSLDVVFDPNDASKAIAEFENGTVRTTADAGQTWSAPISIVVGGGRISLAYAVSKPGWIYAVVVDNPAAGVARLDQEFEEAEGLSPENRPDYDEAWWQAFEQWLGFIEQGPRLQSAGVSGTLYRSEDGGATWSIRGAPAVGLLCAGDVGSGYCQGWYDNVVWADPTDDRRVVAGGIDLFRTDDGGITWTKISDWRFAPDSPHADHHALAAASDYDGATHTTFYDGDDGGMYSAADITIAQTASGWTERNTGLAVTEFYDVAGHAGDTADANGGIVPIIGGSQDNGTLLHDADNTASQAWVTIFGGDGGEVAVDAGNANFLYGEYVYLEIFQSVSGGLGAGFLNPLPPDSGDFSTANFIAPFELDPANSNAMFAGGRSLWYGTGLKSGTLSWRSLNGTSLPTNSVINAITVDGANHNKIWVGLNDGAIYHSTNALATSPQWEQSGGGVLPASLPTDIYLVPDTPTTIYVSYWAWSNTSNLMVSSDGGSTWTSISSGLPPVPVNAVTTLPGDNQMVFAGTATGLYVSTDGGASWSTNDQGPANVAVTQLSWFDPANLVLLAGAYGRGAFLGQVHASPVNPLPTVTGLVPSSAKAGSASFTLRVNGTDFIASSLVQWNDSPLVTTYVSETEVDAVVPASALLTVGTASVTVKTPPPGGGVSNTATFTISDNPVPTVSSLDPSEMLAGSAALTLKVNGSGFVSGSVVLWNGAALATTYVSGSEVDAAVPASALAAAGTVEVSVETPPPGGGTSNQVTFTVNNPVPAIASISPTSATAGDGDLTLKVNGTDFIASSVVQWNGDALATTYVSDTEVDALVPANVLAAAGTAKVSVETPLPGGGTSNRITFTVNNPAPAIASISPTSATAGRDDITLDVAGSGFTPDSVVQWEGVALVTTYLSAGELSTIVPASRLSTAGSFGITVTNPTPGGGISAAVTFTVKKAGGGGGGGAFSLPLLALLLAFLLLTRAEPFLHGNGDNRRWNK